MSFIRAARTDNNQTETVKLFKQLGWTVLIISQLKNCCDIIVSKNGRTIAIEIKNGKQPPSKQKLSDGEQKFKDNWQGEYMIINCTEQVIELNEKGQDNE